MKVRVDNHTLILVSTHRNLKLRLQGKKSMLCVSVCLSICQCVCVPRLRVIVQSHLRGTLCVRGCMCMRVRLVIPGQYF